MILLCDEDVGTKIPRALKLVGLRVISLADKFGLGLDDVTWLTEAGRRGWLAFSCNKAMLNVERERHAIVQEKVGIVFLASGQERLANTLRMLLNKWEWLEGVDREVPRPFAYFLYPGRTKPRRVL